MKILIKNANLISMSEKREKIEENIDVLIENEKISKIERNINEKDADKIIDASKKVVMPGLINTHAHIAMSIFRETLDGFNLQDWLEKQIWPMESKLIDEDIYYASLLTYLEMVKSGCTTINDMYFMSENSVDALIKIPVRLQTSRTLMSPDVDTRIGALEHLIKYTNENPLVSFNAGIHGLYTTNNEDTKKYMEYAKKKNINVHMHFCENSKEVEDIKRLHNVNSPMDVIEENFKDVNTILAHSVKLSDNEIARLGKLKNISVSHCPVSNLKLGCGIAPISKMIDAGINVTLGTDGQGSGSNLDMFETMKYTALLQKGINENPSVLNAYEVLKMATTNGGKALGLDIGIIEEGKLADLIILNLETEQMQPVNNVFSDIVYNAKGSNVETTIVNGKIVMENRIVNGIDEKEIYTKCKEIIERIKI